MKDFVLLLEQLKSLNDAELYEDVKIVADLLIGLAESSSSFASNSNIASTSASTFSCEPKDKYLIYYLHGNAAFHLKEYRLAESMFNKALQINKTNLKPKLKSLNQLDSDTDIEIKFNLNVCLANDKKYQEAFTIVGYFFLQ